MKDVVHIGLLGCGTVGQGVVKLLSDETSPLRERLGLQLKIRKILVRDLKKQRGTHVPFSLLTKDPREIIDDPEIDIVVELLGGIEPAGGLLLQALENQKHIVTANKALLAAMGATLFAKAAKERRHVGFEASVAGGIPILKAISEGFIANRIQKVMGIINGTANYILSEMAAKQSSFEVVLKEAQAAGFAEVDPSLDVNGIDAAHKLAILVALCYGLEVSFEEIFTEGIRQVTLLDLQFAERLGYCLKPLAIAEETGRGIEAHVHPTMIPKGHLLSGVKGAMNAIYLVGDAVGEAMFYGAGAGGLPTASAVVSDIAAIAARLHEPSLLDIAGGLREGKIRSMSEWKGEYYLRFSVVDRPGVLAHIAGVLGDHDISIASVYQQERDREAPVPIVVTTHEAVEKDIQQALEKIEAQETTLDTPVLIRVL